MAHSGTGVGSRLLQLMKPDGVPQAGRVVPHGALLHGDTADVPAAGWREAGPDTSSYRILTQLPWQLTHRTDASSRSTILRGGPDTSHYFPRQQLNIHAFHVPLVPSPAYLTRVFARYLSDNLRWFQKQNRSLTQL
jgi:hypothetical protein